VGYTTKLTLVSAGNSGVAFGIPPLPAFTNSGSLQGNEILNFPITVFIYKFLKIISLTDFPVNNIGMQK